LLFPFAVAEPYNLINTSVISTFCPKLGKN
jgi:hypothetical protein